MVEWFFVLFLAAMPPLWAKKSRTCVTHSFLWQNLRRQPSHSFLRHTSCNTLPSIFHTASDKTLPKVYLLTQNHLTLHYSDIVRHYPPADHSHYCEKRKAIIGVACLAAFLAVVGIGVLCYHVCIRCRERLYHHWSLAKSWDRAKRALSQKRGGNNQDLPLGSFDGDLENNQGRR